MEIKGPMVHSIGPFFVDTRHPSKTTVPNPRWIPTANVLRSERNPDRLNEVAVVGELSLEGQTRGAKGALSMAIAAAKHEGIRGLIVPTANAQEAAVFLAGNGMLVASAAGR